MLETRSTPWIALILVFLASVHLKGQIYADVLIEGATDNIGLDPPQDWSTIVKALSFKKRECTHAKNKTNNSSWNGVDIEKIYGYLNTSFLTDTTFIVGPTGSEVEIQAHSVVLAAASTFLEDAFKQYNASKTFRIPEISEGDFRQLLRFIYIGEVKFFDSNSALVLFKHANLLGLNGVKEVARVHVLKLMTDENVWKVYDIGKETGDKELEKAAVYLASKKADVILQSPGFFNVSRDFLLLLVSQNYLQIDSEFQLYEAIVKWAMYQAQEQQLEMSPAILRQIIGADILKQVRFATMTSAQFVEEYKKFKILSTDESLPIILNINEPGSVPMPESVSNNTQVRIAPPRVNKSNGSLPTNQSLSAKSNQTTLQTNKPAPSVLTSQSVQAAQIVQSARPDPVQAQSGESAQSGGQSGESAQPGQSARSIPSARSVQSSTTARPVVQSARSVIQSVRSAKSAQSAQRAESAESDNQHLKIIKK